jgi:16S rRNA (uracil1498-N3)-methyltransferase
MKISRIYCKAVTSNDPELILDKDLSHYLSSVLRLKLNDRLALFDGLGNEFNGNIIAFNKKQVIVKIKEQISFASSIDPNLVKINLGQAIGKGTKLDLVIQKTTELGIHSITPILSARTIVKINEKSIINKQEHWDKIAIAACCQCKRNVLPIINSPLSIINWIKQCDNDINLILDPLAESSLANLGKLNNNIINILIGPEGGLSDEEVNLAKKFNFTSVKFGPRILRTETAAIAIVAAVQTVYGDLG